jgi:hypothetical protein
MVEVEAWVLVAPADAKAGAGAHTASAHIHSHEAVHTPHHNVFSVQGKAWQWTGAWVLVPPAGAGHTYRGSYHVLDRVCVTRYSCAC